MQRLRSLSDLHQTGLVEKFAIEAGVARISEAIPKADLWTNSYRMSLRRGGVRHLADRRRLCGRRPRPSPASSVLVRPPLRCRPITCDTRESQASRDVKRRSCRIAVRHHWRTTLTGVVSGRHATRQRQNCTRFPVSGKGDYREPRGPLLTFASPSTRPEFAVPSVDKPERWATCCQTRRGCARPSHDLHGRARKQADHIEGSGRCENGCCSETFVPACCPPTR